VKNFLIAAQVLAFVNFLFAPSIAVIIFVAYLTGSTWWFAFIGIPTLFGNLIFLMIAPVRKIVWERLDIISGQQSRRRSV